MPLDVVGEHAKEDVRTRLEVPAGMAACVDLSLARSGTAFPISDIVEAARWGHFERGDAPWEIGQRI